MNKASGLSGAEPTAETTNKDSGVRVYLPLHPRQVLLPLLVGHELLLWCRSLDVLLHLHLFDPQTQQRPQQLEGAELTASD